MTEEGRRAPRKASLLPRHALVRRNVAGPDSRPLSTYTGLRGGLLQWDRVLLAVSSPGGVLVGMGQEALLGQGGGHREQRGGDD